MANQVDKLNDDAVKLELTITRLAAQLKESVGTTNEVNHLNNEINLNFDRLRAKIQLCERMSILETGSDDRTKYSNMAEYHNSQMSELHQLIRQANLACKQAIERSIREELLTGNMDGLVGRQTKETLRQRVTSTTENLQELREMLNTQVHRSYETVEVLANSSNQITQVDRGMSEIGGLISIGSTLITKYGRRVFCDNILIVLGLVLFGLVCLYVFLSRLRIL